MKPSRGRCCGARNGGQAAGQRRVHQLLDAALADVPQLGDRDGAEIRARYATGWPWKLPPLTTSAWPPSSTNTLGLSVALLTSRSSTAVAQRQRVARRAVHLRHAAQRVRVLHLVAVVWLSMMALSVKRARGGSRPPWPGPGAGAASSAVLERPRRALRVPRGSSRRRCRPVARRSPRRTARGRRRRHELRAVDQREPLLGLEG
jgi:hypothetical protein